MENFLSDRQLKCLVEVGLGACHRGRVARARAIFDGILTGKPNCLSARIGRAFSHLVVNEFDQAETLLKSEILAEHPADPEARALLALSYQLSSRSEEAEILYRQLAGESGPAADLARTLLETGG